MEKNHLQWGATLIIGLMSIFFGIQTAELVFNLYPDEIWWMKVVMVASIDGFCLIWYLAKLFYPFRLKSSYDAAVVMWWVCFAISAFCSIILMNFFADTRLHMALDPNWLIGGFWAITGCFIVNLVVFCCVVDAEKGPASIEFVNKIEAPAVKKN